MTVYDSEAFKPDSTSKEIARKLGEDPAQKLRQIEVLRSWIISHNYIQCRTDDLFLLRFLRVCRFSCEKAKKFIEQFCISRSSKNDGIPEWFADQNTKNPILRDIISAGMLYLMPKPDNLGRLVVVAEMEKMPRKHKIDDIMRAAMMTEEWIQHKFERTQLNGVVCLEIACTNFDKRMLTHFTPDKIRKGVEVWEGALPMITNMMHIYNVPTLLRPMMDLMMKFASPESRERIQFHSDLKKDDDIPDDCLPPCLGGTGPSWDDLKDDMIRELDSFQGEFDSLKMCRVDERKMPKHYVQGDSWGIGGSYVHGSGD